MKLMMKLTWGMRMISKKWGVFRETCSMKVNPTLKRTICVKSTWHNLHKTHILKIINYYMLIKYHFWNKSYFYSWYLFEVEIWERNMDICSSIGKIVFEVQFWQNTDSRGNSHTPHQDGEYPLRIYPHLRLATLPVTKGCRISGSVKGLVEFNIRKPCGLLGLKH